MKKLLILLCALLICQPVFGSVMIAEVLYDPINTENGGEAVLLYNDNVEPVDVSNWILATKASSADVVLPPDTSILAGGYLLIADSGFSLDKDDSSWPDPDYEEAMTLANTDAGVALMFENITIDAVGWGNTNEFYEGNPHPGVIEGESLRRISDTGDNSIDFVAGTPVFYDSGPDPLEIIIDVEINITNNNPEILRIEILDDDNTSADGIQIKPLADEVKTFEVMIEAFDADNSSEVETATLILDGIEFEMIKGENNDTNVFFLGNVSMNYFDEAQEYNLTAIITSGNQEFSNITSFEYTSLAALSTNTWLGSTFPPGNSSMETITIRNIGNQALLVSVKGSNLLNGNNQISLENIQVSVNNFENSFTLSENYQEVAEYLAIGENSELEITFNISTDEGLSSGSYHGQFRVKGEII
ncbi:lamin tail domain-containing protein [archaeon]|nr:lamin tail domain-containing protein [archaeon]MBL7057255.1 lamin tail domain-containing protein [Candidatus Woesearchaeota archaeon]